MLFRSTGKMVAALHRLGFYRVFDTNFGADLTIMEEASELLERLTKNTGPIPMITSCSPGWINYCEYFYPELIPNLSTSKSPQSMLGAIIKTYYAEKNNLDPKDIFVVSIMHDFHILVKYYIHYGYHRKNQYIMLSYCMFRLPPAGYPSPYKPPRYTRPFLGK